MLTGCWGLGVLGRRSGGFAFSFNALSDLRRGPARGEYVRAWLDGGRCGLVAAGQSAGAPDDGGAPVVASWDRKHDAHAHLQIRIQYVM